MQIRLTNQLYFKYDKMLLNIDILYDTVFSRFINNKKKKTCQILKTISSQTRQSNCVAL